jgi:hypothetical protein
VAAVSTLADALLSELDEHALAVLAERVSPYLDHGPTDDGWLRGAKAIAAYIDAPVSRVEALSSAKRIPVEHDGSALIARRSVLDAWIGAGGGKRP